MTAIPSKYHLLASDLKRSELAALEAQRPSGLERLGFLMLLVLACGGAAVAVLFLRAAWS